MSNTKAIDKVINVLKSLHQQKFINLNFLLSRNTIFQSQYLLSSSIYKRIRGYLINNVSFRDMFESMYKLRKQNSLLIRHES